MKKKFILFTSIFYFISFQACSQTLIIENLPGIQAGATAQETSAFCDKNDKFAPVPKEFYVSTKQDEQTVNQGLVIIGPDKSEFVWVPMKESDFKNDPLSSSGFFDEKESSSYKQMKNSVLKYDGFYIGRYETSHGKDDVPQSKKAGENEIWVHIPPEKMITVCEKMYRQNKTVKVFLPWGITWDRTLLWLVESGCKTERQVKTDSSEWGNYSNNNFNSTDYAATGAYKQTKANNIYDLAGNFWEWTQERASFGGYAARSGGYGVMGGPCPGYRSPAAFRSGLPGNDHHPNISFRIAMYIQ